MYRITIEDKSVDVVLPCWVKYEAIHESWMTCNEDNAEAVLVTMDEEQLYADIDTKPFRHDDFPLAHIEYIGDGDGQD